MIYGTEPRELRIINSIRTAGFLSTEQVRRLHFAEADGFAEGFASHRTVTGVLRRIREDWGALERTRFPRNWRVDCGALHILNPKWERRRLISANCDMPDGERRKISRRINRKHTQLTSFIHSQYRHALHHYAVNDVWIWLQRPSSRADVYQRFDVHCSRKFYTVIPDAVMVLGFNTPEGRPESGFFLEVDRNTERYEVLYDKFERYQPIVAHDDTLLLFIEERRSRNVARVLQAAADAGIADRFFMTNIEDVFQAHWLDDRIWLSPERGECALLDWYR